MKKTTVFDYIFTALQGLVGFFGAKYSAQKAKIVGHFCQIVGQIVGQ